MTETNTKPAATEMTEAEALDEALLLLIRKTRRAMGNTDLMVSVFGRDVWAKLPDGAKAALLQAEGRADRHRNTADGVRALVWPAERDPDSAETADAA